MSDGGNFAIRIDGQSILTDNCGTINPYDTKRNSADGTFTATSTGMVPVEIYSWRTGDEFDPIHNYIDNVRVTAQTYSLEADSRELDTYNGSSSELKIDVGPAYAGKYYIILQGMSGSAPGFDMSMGTVHVPLNVDSWTLIAFNFYPVWTGFQGQLDAEGKATAVLNTYGPQPSAWAQAIYHVCLVLENPYNTPIFASNSVYTLFVVV